jgi:SAM-dependent methyltransferase
LASRDPSISIEEIKQEIRQHIHPATGEPAGIQSVSSSGIASFPKPDGGDEEPSLKRVERCVSRIGDLPPRPPTKRGRVGAVLVRAVRRALFWYTSQLADFGDAVAGALARMWGRQRALTSELASLSQEATKLRDEFNAHLTEEERWRSQQSKDLHELSDVMETYFRAAAEQVKGQVAGLTQRLDAVQSLASRAGAETATRESLASHLVQVQMALSQQERRVSMLLEELHKLPSPLLQQNELQAMVKDDRQSLDALYVSFEDQFRGTREDILSRLRVYLPILRQHKIGGKRMPILDIACGRGEWLELLREEGLKATGVDINQVVVAQCSERGLAVTEADFLDYLRTLPGSNLGAVTGFHIVEHLPFHALIELLDETMRVLKPGGLAIFETPNPDNILVGASTFYLDFTHLRPLPSALLRFLAASRGLCDVQILALHPYSDDFHVTEPPGDLTKRFNEHFYGARDYAVIGKKV